MPKLEVYCTVNNCDYWGKNNHCLAEKILIVNDAQAAAWPDSVDAPDGAKLESVEAETCMETACKTFRPRYSHAGPVQDQRNTDAYLAQKFPHQ
ncbi:MAG TPA: DUF1540 domain-containing protein [Symbiobacteriaceae bacterium]|nr:DUF1540 domain-containing protein [Symbiobacteriaceae bacterium]